MDRPLDRSAALWARPRAQFRGRNIGIRLRVFRKSGIVNSEDAIPDLLRRRQRLAFAHAR